MEATPTNMLPFASSIANLEAEAWITAYTQDVLAAKDAATIEAYTRILKRFTEWLSARPGNHDPVHAGEPRARKRKAEASPGVAPNAPGDAYQSKSFANVRRGLTYEKNDHQICEHARYPLRTFRSTRCRCPFLPVPL